MFGVICYVRRYFSKHTEQTLDGLPLTLLQTHGRRRRESRANSEEFFGPLDQAARSESIDRCMLID